MKQLLTTFIFLGLAVMALAITSHADATNHGARGPRTLMVECNSSFDNYGQTITATLTGRMDRIQLSQNPAHPDLVKFNGQLLVRNLTINEKLNRMGSTGTPAQPYHIEASANANLKEDLSEMRLEFNEVQSDNGNIITKIILNTSTPNSQKQNSGTVATNVRAPINLRCTYSFAKDIRIELQR